MLTCGDRVDLSVGRIFAIPITHPISFRPPIILWASVMMNWAKVKQSVVSEESAPSAWDVADVDKRDANGKTALLNACEKGDADRRLLLIQRASPDACATDGQSPLYLACRAGSLECARMLLQRQRGCITHECGLFSAVRGRTKGTQSCCNCCLRSART